MNGLRVLLVGGSGGLGKATAELLAGEGASLVIAYRNDSRRAAQVRHLGETVQADITIRSDRKRLLASAGPLDAAVVFAGSPARVQSPEELEEQTLRSALDNYAGPMLLAHEIAADMHQRHCPGAIVLLATMQAVALFPGSTAYGAAKAALVHAARLLAKERRDANIRVNVIAPGVIDAGMAQASIAAGKYDRFVAEKIVTRFGRPHDVARAVRFLLEPDSYITGQVLSVDGGITL